MNIVILDGKCAVRDEYNYDFLKKYGNVTVYERTASSEITERAKNADIILTNKVIISKDAFAQLPRLKMIQTLATGYNIIDIEEAKRRNIPVCNIPSYSSPSVAQVTIGLLIEIANRIGLHDTSVKCGEWANCIDFCYAKTKQIELQNKTIGLIGYGAIAKQVAKICKAMGMTTLGYRRSGGTDSYAEMVDLDTLITKSDIISLHCPETAETAKFINTKLIHKMKDGVIILNTARGGIVDELAIAEALKSGKIYGYGADVLNSEPPATSHPFINLANAVITPHIGWASTEARGRLLEILEDNISGFLSGEIKNKVY